MARATKLAIGILVGCGVALVVVTPRALRCIKYERLLSADTMLKRLTIVPTFENPSYIGSTENVDVGYAVFSLPSEWLSASQAMETWIVLTDSNEGSNIVLFKPHNESQFSVDSNFTFARRSFYSRPSSSRGVFLMSQRDYQQHILAAIPKMISTYNERGISEFATDNVKGFIQHGAADEPDRLKLSLWSIDCSIAVEMEITIPNAELRKEIFTCIVSTFRFTLDSPPTESRIADLVEDAAMNINQQFELSFTR